MRRCGCEQRTAEKVADHDRQNHDRQTRQNRAGVWKDCPKHPRRSGALPGGISWNSQVKKAQNPPYRHPRANPDLG